MVLALGQVPALAGGDITSFKVRNCASERIFVCSFDKTDSLMKIPYKAKGIKPGDKKQLGCASLKKCKVIIGVSKKKTKKTLSKGMKTALAATSGGAAAVTGVGAGLFYTVGAGVMNYTSVAALGVVGGAGVAAVVSLGAAGAVAGLEISDGWSDGEVCNQVRKAAQKAGIKPKYFLKNGNTYTVIPQYAVTKNGRAYVNPDGTAVFTYVARKGKSCPAALKTQLVPN
jgi:hypothetical protein